MGGSARAVQRGHGSPGMAIQLRSIGVSFGGRAILDRLDLDIDAGGTTCILGPSGIGKSTLLHRIAGLVSGDGSVHAADGRPLQGRIAWMGQTDLLLPWLNVRDNIMLGARLRAEPYDLTRFSSLVLDVGLDDALTKRPAELSGGMRQRAALARTLMEDRPVVLMDEPFSSVDALARLRLQDLGARLLAGRTVVMVTHDPWEAIRIGHRILVLSGSPARIALDLRPGEPRLPRAVDTPEATRLWREIVSALGIGT
ncbi:MAG: ABC transporter ATP-binding protein [Pseudomonadota bacterium]|nr:ABC transporter ATP-binding protein [Pseudomonadota bacterium]